MLKKKWYQKIYQLFKFIDCFMETKILRQLISTKCGKWYEKFWLDNYFPERKMHRTQRQRKQSFMLMANIDNKKKTNNQNTKKH